MPAAPTATRRYWGMTPDARRSRRRTRLLGAALALFGTRGYDRTTVRQICARARLTERYFYESFGSREELLVTLFHDISGEMARRILESIEAAPSDTLARARAAVDGCVGYLAEDRRRHRILFREAVGSSRELERHRRAMIHEFSRLVRQTARDFRGPGPDTSTDAYLTSLAVVPGLVQLITEWVEGTLEVSRERLVDHCAALMITVAEVSSSGGAAEGCGVRPRRTVRKRDGQ